MNQTPLPGPYTKQEVRAFFIAIAVVGTIIYFLFFKSDASPKLDVNNSGYSESFQQSSYSPQPEYSETKSYSIISQDTISIEDKRQIITMVAMKNSFESEDEMKKSIYEVYDNEAKSTLFPGGKPNTIGVYLYSSSGKMNADKKSWNMMLFKAYQDKEPELTIAESMSVANDNSSKDGYQSIQSAFQSKGLDYCNFYQQVQKWITQSNKMDDDYYFKHPHDATIGVKLADDWLNNKIDHWLKKNRLPDSLSTTITYYGAAFCQ